MNRPWLITGIVLLVIAVGALGAWEYGVSLLFFVLGALAIRHAGRLPLREQRQ